MWNPHCAAYRTSTFHIDPECYTSKWHAESDNHPIWFRIWVHPQILEKFVIFQKSTFMRTLNLHNYFYKWASRTDIYRLKLIFKRCLWKLLIRELKNSPQFWCRLYYFCRNILLKFKRVNLLQFFLPKIDNFLYSFDKYR